MADMADSLTRRLGRQTRRQFPHCIDGNTGRFLEFRRTRIAGKSCASQSENRHPPLPKETGLCRSRPETRRLFLPGKMPRRNGSTGGSLGNRRTAPASPPAVTPRSNSALAGSLRGIFRRSRPPFRLATANPQPAPRGPTCMPRPPVRRKSRMPRPPGPPAHGNGRFPERQRRLRRRGCCYRACSGQPWPVQAGRGRRESPVGRHGL